MTQPDVDDISASQQQPQHDTAAAPSAAPIPSRRERLLELWQGFVWLLLGVLALGGLIAQQSNKAVAPAWGPEKLWNKIDKPVFDTVKGFILSERCGSVMKARHPELYGDGFDTRMSAVGSFDWPIERFDVFKDGQVNYPLSAFYCTAIGPIVWPDIRVNLNPSSPINDWQ
ncbi:hypothetical protein [Deinococcus sp.]|uniref:hypothetical protein n=1 Tax=Deinococcus sp. TaxID=47478 RepID=UPI003CC5B313